MQHRNYAQSNRNPINKKVTNSYNLTRYLFIAYLASFLYVGTAQALVYAGSCKYNFDINNMSANDSEVKSEEHTFAWEYSKVDTTVTHILTSLGIPDVGYEFYPDELPSDLHWSHPISSIHIFSNGDGTYSITSHGKTDTKPIVHCASWTCENFDDTKCQVDHITN